jgi:alkyl hydroperoxide reductase subunit AhpF
MAVTANKTDCNMVIRYNEGVDQYGVDIVKSQKFSGVKTTALDQDIFDVAKALETLMPAAVVEIVRNDENVLMNE